ncbi:MAG: ATP-binding protein [Terriglobales bacterium]|jgi:PAS domain S-box-containing protein
MPEMQAADGISPPSSSAPVVNTIVVWVLGVIGLLTIIQWTAITVGKHVRIASHSLFPAALQSQHATNTFQRMSNAYSDAAVMDKEEALAFADQEAAEAVSALASAGDLIQFNSGRHQQIVSLARRVRDLQMRSKMFYAAPGNLNVVPPRQKDLADLAQENKRVQQELEALQGDLANDFRSELALIDKLVTTQAILESLLLVGVLTALFFRTRALISATVRRRGDEVLRQAHRDTEILLNSIPSLLIELDARGNIRQWNKAATSILEWEEATVAGKTLDCCGVKWLTPDVSSRIAAHAQVPSGRGLDNVKLEKNGTTRFLGLNAIPLNTDGAAGILVVGADITDRLTLEHQLLQAQKLESVGQLAAGIAHEINTPTQYIGDNVRFLKEAFHDLEGVRASYERLLAAAQNNAVSGETVQEVMDRLQHADANYLFEEIPKAIDQSLEGVTRVAKIVGAMKEFSHPGTKDKTQLDLNHAIECTLTVARNEWKYVAELETEFDPSLPRIACQPGEFNQVILNLIVNAAHAIADVVGKDGSKKGTIKVQTRNCKDWAEIRIHDTGTGIPDSVRARVFDPFFTTKEIGKGTGQGLAIARSVVVDKHGGTIHFETAEGRGTTFVIRLPKEGKALTARTGSA